MARLFNIVVAAHDPLPLAEFWSRALGYNVVQSQSGLARISPPATDPGPNLLFLKSDDVPAHSVIHLDLAATDPAKEVQRLEQLGATPVDQPTAKGKATWREANGIRWIVLADPEGNEFCIGAEPIT